MKLTKRKIILLLSVLAVMVFTFIWGGNYAAKSTTSNQIETNPSITQENDMEVKQSQEKVEEPENQENKKDEEKKKEEEKKEQVQPGSPVDGQEQNTENMKNESQSADNKGDKTPDKAVVPLPAKNEPAPKMLINPKTGKDKYLTDPVPEGKPLPVEWQDVQIDTNTKLSCTLSIRCDTILDNMKIFNKDKMEVLPQDGVIFPEKMVDFYKGESVFNVLQREMKKHKIHMEFVMTPMYNSVYVEGIHNLYEFDTGELSGWMYKVNDWFPNYGASRYQLQDGDKIEWVYTCDLGRDVGGFFIMENDIPEDKKKILEERIKEEEKAKENPSGNKTNP